MKILGQVGSSLINRQRKFNSSTPITKHRISTRRQRLIRQDGEVHEEPVHQAAKNGSVKLLAVTAKVEANPKCCRG